MEESRDATVTVAPPGDVKTEVVKAPFAPTSVPPPSGQKVVMSQNELATEKKRKELERLERRRDNARRAKRKSTHPEHNDASSGEEYPESLMGNYIGQVRVSQVRLASEWFVLTTQVLAIIGGSTLGAWNRCF